MERMLQQAWTRRAWLARLLWPLSVLHLFLWTLRKSLYRRGFWRSESVGVPVVVVGNVIAGGAGKTPLVLALAEHLCKQGWQPGIVSRGYGRRLASRVLSVRPDSSPFDVGDEALLLHRRLALPVVVGANRVEAARQLRREHPQVNILLSDDGLQHLALQRDLEICVFDERGIGNGWMLPAGPLREPWPRAVDLLVGPAGSGLGADCHTPVRRLAPAAQRASGESVSLEALRGVAIVAVAGIAQPSRFFAMLQAQGLRLVRCVALPDHHDFASGPVALLPGERLLCTEKDAVKLWPIQPEALAVALTVDLPPALLLALDEKLRKLRT